MKLPGNMGDLFAQAQKLQESMAQMQDDLAKREVEASSGGGMVTVKVSGAQLVTALKIDKTVINPDDSEMLEDLVRAAVNEGMRKSRDMMKDELGKLTGGIPIPGFS